MLVHGLGSHPGWWNPIVPALGGLGIRSSVPTLASLEETGPDAWVTQVKREAGSTPVILMGHSLGAAVCLRAALEIPVALLVLLALPPFAEDYAPQPPRHALSPEAIRRVSLFLRTASARAREVTCETVHFVGDADRSVPVEQAARLPFPLVVIPGVGHQLNRSSAALAAIVEHAARASRHGDGVPEVRASEEPHPGDVDCGP